MNEIKFCPICGHKIDTYYESAHPKPFVHTDPMKGLEIYSAYTSPKQTHCSTENFLHFSFADGEHRLVRLGVAEPIEPSYPEPSEYENSSDLNDLPF